MMGGSFIRQNKAKAKQQYTCDVNVFVFLWWELRTQDAGSVCPRFPVFATKSSDIRSYFWRHAGVVWPEVVESRVVNRL